MRVVHDALRELCGSLSRCQNIAISPSSMRRSSLLRTLLGSRTAPRLLHRQQLLKAAQSVSANIAEGFGRATTADRCSRFVIARAEAEETIKHLRANLTSKRIAPGDYWPRHNKAVAIVKMLNSLLA